MASDRGEHAFVKVPLDVEPGASEADDFTARHRKSLRRSAIGLAFVGLLVLGTLALRRGLPQSGTELAATEDTLQAYAKSFQQCGGQDYTGSTCCQKGCACILKSRFYSMCATPSNTGKCSVQAAQEEIALAKSRVGKVKDAIATFAKAAKAKEKQVAPFQKAYDKAREPLEKLRKDGHKAHEAWKTAEGELKDAKEAATEAATIADKAAKKYGWVKKHLDHFDEAEDLNKGGQCASIGGQCGGQIAASKACCIIGCVCHWKNAFYGQCRAPKGKTTCDEAGWRAEEAETREHATKLGKIADKTGAEKDRTAQVLKEKEESHDAKKKAAIKAGTKRAQAEKHARIMKHHLDQATKTSEEAQAKADHAVHNVKFAAANVGIWKKVAGGDSCSDLDGSTVLAADMINYEDIEESGSSDDDSGKTSASEESEEDSELKSLDDDLDLDLDDSELDEFDDATSV